MEQSTSGVKPRVLFTGNGNRMVENLMDLVMNRYRVRKCLAKENLFADAVASFQPHVVVVCLQDEQKKDLKAYSVLETNSAYAGLPILLIGHKADCEMFQKKMLIKNLHIMERPLNMELFAPKLVELTEQATETEREKRVAQEAEKAEKASAAPVAQPATGGSHGMSDKQVMFIPLPEDRKSILVVDDDVRMLNVIKLYLQDFYEVTVVPSGKLALKFLSKKHADLVLLDYLMPEMDGPQVLKEIRLNSPNASVPVLFLTGVSDKDMVMKTLEYSPTGYLLKPVTREALLERVMEIMLDL